MVKQTIFPKMHNVPEYNKCMLEILCILGNRGRQKNVNGRRHPMGELVVRKCCTSLLCYLDNRSAVGVMANNTLRLHHNARKLVFGEKTIMRRVL